MSHTHINEASIPSITLTTNQPVILKEFLINSDLCQWSEEKWCTAFGDKEIPFRLMDKFCISDEPCWERKCTVKDMTFKKFLELHIGSPQWMYFDYKYLHQWFSCDSEILQGLPWSKLGFPEKTAADSTLWIGSEGAHTPAHQDTYGSNIVTQLYGKKRWLLFPPETGGLKPTRVPYEESSIYSELNFYCPSDLDAFKGVNGARCVELCPGDVLIVPRGWWHYVENVAPLSIALNMWLPHEKDKESQVSEALVKLMIAQICKDLPAETAKLIVNPNENDLADTPLAVMFLQLETVAKAYLDTRRKLRRVKRQRTVEAVDQTDQSPSNEVDLKAIIANPDNKVIVAPTICNEDLIKILKDNVAKYANKDKHCNQDDIDGSVSSLRLTKALINAFSDPETIEVAKQKLFARLS